jgi:hypothetical protein
MNKVRPGSGKIDRRNLLTGIVGVGAVSAIGVSPLARALSSASDGPIATTEYGKIRGVAANKVLSFRGVPYGGPT